jgi:conjugative transposon TraM protein
MKNQHSAEFLRRRKFLMVLPLLVLPFLTMAFWALGGGGGNNNPKTVRDSKKGFNTELPQARFSPDEKQDKWSAYESSAKDSQELKRIYSQLSFSEVREEPTDPNEERINEKLAQINSEINRQEPEGSTTVREKSKAADYSGDMNADVNRLENLMQSMQSGNEEDPEMKQLNEILEKILLIQNSERIGGRLNDARFRNQESTYPVQVAGGMDTSQNVFAMTGNLDGKYENYVANAIQATIHQDQEIISGSVIKLRLLDSMYVKGTLIPKNEFVYGIASVEGERLKIGIATLRYRNSILPVALSAYDLDGLEGLYIPGAITRDAAKRGMDDAIQNLQVLTMDPSVSAQVAGAGIEAAKGLFSKKAKQVKVKVKAGYQLLLRDTDQRTY